MKRKPFLGLAGVVALALAAFFTFAPGVVERGMNQLDGEPILNLCKQAASEAAAALGSAAYGSLLGSRPGFARLISNTNY